MENIRFEVSAKTARLIGRENIAGVDGAISELVKNAYDADATCVCLRFDMPFPRIPSTIESSLANKVFNNKEKAYLLKFYSFDTSILTLKKDMSLEESEELTRFLFSKNTIIIADNGHGMDRKILTSAWMNIGTSNKEIDRQSSKGRIKTGEKGIGRFALDKLSLQTLAISKNSQDELLKWFIDWEQFERVTLLNEVSASLEISEQLYIEEVKKYFPNFDRDLSSYNWETGTLIGLSPTREQWSDLLFGKVNKALKNIYPTQYAKLDDIFDIYVDNTYFSGYSYRNEKMSLTKKDYDYRINARFDGIRILHVELTRNEVSINNSVTKQKINNKEYTFPLNDFWQREAFKLAGYQRKEFEGTRHFDVNLEFQDIKGKNSLNSVGEFAFELFFLKSTKSPMDIIKPVVASRRKSILKDYSGIKLYRDGFKVRPYGDEGALFDWLKLGERAQKSPASVGHSEGSWRVMPYQIMGSVNISRDGNPYLVDMANRESLTQNECYELFISIIQVAISRFENDRQYFFRELAKWTELKEKSLQPSSQVIDSLKHKGNEGSGSNGTDVNSSTQEQHNSGGDSKKEYSTEEYENTVLFLDKSKEREVRTNQTLMIFSSAGIMTNTFSHELQRIANHAGNRMQQLEVCIERLLDRKEYVGDPDFNPFFYIREIEKTDILIESWINVIMNGVNDDSFQKKDFNIYELTEDIVELWKPLLHKKFIEITFSSVNKKIITQMAEVDLHIILNNFILNSSWFLESSSNKRLINIILTDEDDRIRFLLENNGPPISDKYLDNLDLIFEAGETTKPDGTGVGLWIVREVVSRLWGEIHAMDRQVGFGIELSIPKQ